VARALTDADGAQPRGHRRRDNKIYVIGGRVGAAFIGVASTPTSSKNTTRRPISGAPCGRASAARSAGAWGTLTAPDLRAGGEFQNGQLMAAFRALEATTRRPIAG